MDAGYVETGGVSFPQPVPETVPPPTHIPVGGYIITPENGMTLTFDGAPVNPDYGQITDSGMYQVPVDPADPSGTGSLGAGAHQDAGALGVDGFETTAGGCGGAESQLYAEYYNAQLEETTATTMMEQQVPDIYTYDPFAEQQMLEQQTIETYTYDPSSIGLGNVAAGAGVVAVGHAAGAHAHHGLDAILSKGAEEGIKAGAKQVAKLAVKSLWMAHETGSPLPTYGNAPGQIEPTREFFEEYNRVTQTEQWKQLMAYVERRDKGKNAPLQNRNGVCSISDVAVRQRDCLAIIEAEGYDRKLNDPARLKFFIQKADGNVVYVRAWIIEYLKKKG
jgi:hypothetical protein